MERKIEGLVLDGDEWFTVDMTAAITGLTVAAIYKRIERGQLEPREILGIKAIAASDIRRLWPQPEPQPEPEPMA